MSMRNPSAITAAQAKAIAGDSEIELDDAYRGYLNAFIEADTAAKNVQPVSKRLQDVGEDIFIGSPEGDYQGINQRNTNTRAALESGDVTEAQVQVRGLKNLLLGMLIKLKHCKKLMICPYRRVRM